MEGVSLSGLRVRRGELAFLYCSDIQHTFPLVTSSVMWMAVLVCKVRGPVLILEVPLARAMRMMSWQNKTISKYRLHMHHARTGNIDDTSRSRDIMIRDLKQMIPFL